MLGDPLDLAAEEIAKTQVGTKPQKRAEQIEDQKLAQTHLENTGERHRYGVEAGEEFGEEKRPCALLLEKTFGPANTRIRLQRDAAKPLQHFNSLVAPQLIPDRVGRDGREHAEEESGDEVHAAHSREGSGR